MDSKMYVFKGTIPMNKLISPFKDKKDNTLSEELNKGLYKYADGMLKDSVVTVENCDFNNQKLIIKTFVWGLKIGFNYKSHIIKWMGSLIGLQRPYPNSVSNYEILKEIDFDELHDEEI